MSDGLYNKYEVTRQGELVEGCFVLRPETDPVARDALATYALRTPDRELAKDLWDWMYQIRLTPPGKEQ